MSLVEAAQRARQQEQANATRVRWEFRTEITRNRRGQKLVRVQIMVPEPIAALMAKHGPTSVVGRRILEHWATIAER